MVSLSIDAMGGDFGPAVTVAGVARMAQKHAGVSFLLFGDGDKITAELARFPHLRGRVEVIACEIAIAMDEKPSQALRRGRHKSSMWRALDAVRTGRAQACVSAGNTGALMAMARFCLKMLAGIDRPALACTWPTARGASIVLDVGAAIGADAEDLVDMAMMGAAMARIVLSLPRPSVGLLNVGVEEIKGIEQVKEAARFLREAALPGFDYIGYVEGDDIGKGSADVVVTEGFAGNIALKTAEGTAKQIAGYLRAGIERSWAAKIGYLFAKSAFAALRDKMDPRKVNGAVFLGLEGIVVKSHGGTDEIGFASAIEVAYDMAHHNLLARIAEAVQQRGERAGVSDLAQTEDLAPQDLTLKEVVAPATSSEGEGARAVPV